MTPSRVLRQRLAPQPACHRFGSPESRSRRPGPHHPRPCLCSSTGITDDASGVSDCAESSHLGRVLSPSAPPWTAPLDRRRRDNGDGVHEAHGNATVPEQRSSRSPPNLHDSAAASLSAKSELPAGAPVLVAGLVRPVRGLLVSVAATTAATATGWQSSRYLLFGDGHPSPSPNSKWKLRRTKGID